ncbi:hypothetical protein Tco_1090784 [Tanacetum coccineum]|uniref:Uncharacterized protein n=1 Tax=Tanacetum coccineum TaxID=301880 RepID=A0ABQ5I580_9ASTR
MTESPLMDSSFAIPVFSLRDDPIACLNKAMTFLTAVASSRGDKVKVILVLGLRVMLLALGETILSRQARVAKRYNCQVLAEAQEAGQILDEEQLTFLADLGVPDGTSTETYLNDMVRQGVLEMQDFEQPPAVDFIDNEIHSDSNIIPYSQYLQETQQENVQEYEKANKEQTNESVTAELERYKERVKTFEQRLNIDLSSREKIIDSQIDDMTKEKLALKEQVDLNRLTKDFGKRFTPQQELLAEQAFWLRMSDPTSKPSDALPVKIEVPKELPKISLVNESLKKLKFHLAKFDNVVKIRTTPNARNRRDLLNEIMEVKTVFDQMTAAVSTSLVD